MHTSISAVKVQWTVRSARLNRDRSRVDAAAPGIVDTPLLPDPAVDVVATRLPVARDLAMCQLDPGQPLGAFVPIVRGDVHPHRTAVVVSDRSIEHLQGD